MKILLILVLCFSYETGNAQGTQNYLQKGNEFYQKANYPEAIKLYQQALKKSPSDKTILFNLGNAFYKSGDYPSAITVFEKTMKNETDTILLSNIYYNYGVSLFRFQRIKEAVLAFKYSLRLNPGNKPCRQNLYFSLQKLRQETPISENPGDDKNNTEEKDKKKETPTNPKTGEAILTEIQKQEQKFKDSMQKAKKKPSIKVDKDW